MRCCCPQRRHRVVVLGASEKAGATTVTLRLHFHKVVTSIPANATEIWPSVFQQDEKKSWKVQLIDVGREGKTPKALQTLLEDATGLIFVVDSTHVGPQQRQLFDLATSFLPRTAGVYVLANFQDRQSAQSATTICQYLGLPVSTEPVPSTQFDEDDRDWRPLPRWTCQPCVATHPGLCSDSIYRFILLGDLEPLFAVAVDSLQTNTQDSAHSASASSSQRDLESPTSRSPQNHDRIPLGGDATPTAPVGGRFLSTLSKRLSQPSSERDAAAVDYVDVDGEDSEDHTNIVNEPTNSMPLTDAQKRKRRKSGVGPQHAPLLSRGDVAEAPSA